MQKITVSAETLSALMFELFKEKPWLNTAGVMVEADASAEAEAIDFLLSLDTAKGWGKCSIPARRVVNSLLLDFIAKLLSPSSALSRASWQVPAKAAPWNQAIHAIVHEIRQSHPRFQSPH